MSVTSKIAWGGGGGGGGAQICCFSFCLRNKVNCSPPQNIITTFFVQTYMIQHTSIGDEKHDSFGIRWLDLIIELGEGGGAEWLWLGGGWGVSGSGSGHLYCNICTLISNDLIHSNNQFCSWYSVYPLGLTSAHPLVVGWSDRGQSRGPITWSVPAGSRPASTPQ